MVHHLRVFLVPPLGGKPALSRSALRGALKRASKARPPEPEEPERAAQIPGWARCPGGACPHASGATGLSPRVLLTVYSAALNGAPLYLAHH